MVPSYACGLSSKPLIGKTIGDLLDEIVEQHPANEALVSVFEKRRFTYPQFLEEVNRATRAMMALGVQKGDRLGIWSTNCADWTITQFAAAKTGAILVNINPALRLHEVEYTLQQSQCNYLISGESFKDDNYIQVLHELVPKLPSEERFPHLRKIIFLRGEWNPADTGRMSWPEFLGLHRQTTPQKLAERQASLDFDEVINIQYTSGTTGFPKGAMLTHRNILNNGFWVGERMRLTDKDRLCIPVPFYHCFGMVMGNLTCVTHGATMVLPAPHFSPVHTLEAVAQEKCTALHGVPTMFIAQLEHPDFKKFDLSSLRTGIMAGAPCPEEIMKKVIKQMHCKEITIACGMTESSPVCNMTEVDDPIEIRVGSIGKVMPHQEQKIIDPYTGKIVPRGTHGELCYRGYNIMKGYYNNPEGTAQAIDANGWLHGGDVAVMDEQGYVRMTGRIKDMIARGGEKIFPHEVENFLYTHPKIIEAHVIGVPDHYYGEQVMAWVKLREGQSMTKEELQQFCHGQINDYSVPHYVKFVTEFPTTVTGKIQKYKMRDLSIGEMGLKSK